MENRKLGKLLKIKKLKMRKGRKRGNGKREKEKGKSIFYINLLLINKFS